MSNNHAAVGTGSSDHAIAVVDISPDETAEMTKLARERVVGRAPREIDYWDTDAHFRLAELNGSILPERVREALAELRDGTLDAVVVQGLPADPFRKYARNGQSDERADARRTQAMPQPLLGWTWLGMITRQLGHEYGYRAEKSGSLVHDVRPRPDGAATQSNESYRVELQLHTEVAFHEIRPDFVLLYGVQTPEPRPATRLVRLSDALAHCSPETVRRLSEPQFRIAAPVSFALPNATVDSIRPLDGTQRWPTIRWHNSITGRTVEDQAAIADFRAAAERLAYPVRLAAGSLLAFSNRRCLHGREPFEAHHDGRDRWLLRTYVLRDITQLTTAYRPTTCDNKIQRLAEWRCP